VRPISTASLLVGTALLSGIAAAHAVGADAYVVDEGKVIQVEAWISGGNVPKKGTVLVLGEDEREVAKGELEDGVFRFRPQVAERFFFVVSLGEGHVKKFTISDKQFAKLRIDGAGGTSSPEPLPGSEAADTYRGAEREPEDRSRTLERALLGLLLIAMATAVAIEVKMNKRLRRLEQAVEREGERGDGDTSS